MAVILELIAVLLPAFIGFSGKIIKGKKRWIIAIAAYFILKKMAIAAAKSKQLSELQSGTAATSPSAIAGLFKLALNPSGYDFLMTSDGTDEDLIFEMAAKTKNYKAVYDSYQIQFDRDLTVDLQSELSTTDYKRFIDILG